MSDPTEEATPRRLDRARREGDSGASHFAARAVGLWAVIAILPSATAATGSWFVDAIHRSIAQVARADTTPDWGSNAWALVGLTAPILLATGVVGAAATLVQTGGVLAPGNVAPRLDRIAIGRGLGALFSWDRAITSIRAVVYGLAALVIVGLEVRAHALDFAHLAGRAEKLGPFVLAVILETTEKIAITGIALAVLDAVATRMLWRRRLRMTKEEVARERRESEGDPHVKQERTRAFQALLASSGNIEGATIVVSDGETRACALRYRAELDAAPIVLSVGRELAGLAEKQDIPLAIDRTLARLLVQLDVGAAIPERLYDDVAELLATARTS